MTEPTKKELLETDAKQFDTNSLHFIGLRGDASKHIPFQELEAMLNALPPAPKHEGELKLLLARGKQGSRELPREVTLTVDGGMPKDRWALDDRYGPEFQLATTQWDYAHTIANGQPMELHGDNIFLDLDLSEENLAIGSELTLGEARLVVTPKPHNGCKKWVQRFGLAPMQLNMAPHFRKHRLRGIYLQVIESGRVCIGDFAKVSLRGTAST